MKTGTFLCWLFGHKFMETIGIIDGAEIEYYHHLHENCIRCGIDKEKK